jgi:hypothetical protein
MMSAYYAIGEQKLVVTRSAVREAIEDGYRDAMDKGGSPYVLAERYVWLRQIAMSKLRDPVRFWQKIETCPDYRGKVPKLAHDLLRGCMPVKDAAMQMKTRIGGTGQPGASADTGSFSMARRAHGARSESADAFRLDLGQRREKTRCSAVAGADHRQRSAGTRPPSAFPR